MFDLLLRIEYTIDGEDNVQLIHTSTGIICMEKLKSSQVRDKPFMFLGHRDTVMGVFFGVDKKTNKEARTVACMGVAVEDLHTEAAGALFC